ncbi:helix-turn-helix transcriptional regulator [bacterium]|nr:helix-turn-helix transcriptional regulator [bacterium]
MEEGTALTSRERQVLALLNQGASRSAIAQALRVRPDTVKVHVFNLRRKLNLTAFEQGSPAENPAQKGAGHVRGHAD